jgi:hypothetical protein
VASGNKPIRPPATTPEGRENQLVAAAMDLAEKQIREGKASSQVITHFLKLGSTRERAEQDRLANENLLLQAKVSSLQSAERMEQLYAEAMAAMTSYKGLSHEEVIDDPNV